MCVSVWVNLMYVLSVWRAIVCSCSAQTDGRVCHLCVCMAHFMHAAQHYYSIKWWRSSSIKILFIASFVNLMWKMFHSTHAPSIHVHICNRGILTSDYNETRSHIIICALGISFCYRFFQSFSSTQSIHLSLYRVGVGRSWKRFCAEVFGNLLAFWQFANSRCVWVSTKWKLKSQPIDIDRDNVLHTSMPTINFWIFSHIFF